MRRNLLKSMLMAAGLLGALAAPAHPKDGVVYTVNYPLQYFAEAIAGADLEIVFPAPPGIDPAEWSPGVETLLGYQGADLVLLNGAGYDRWTKAAYLARSRLVDTSAGFADRLIPLESDDFPHIHGPGGAEVTSEAVAFTTWLDLSLARAQAKAVLDALALRWPENVTSFTARHAVLDADLAALDAALAAALEILRGRPAYASHPVYQYLGRHYGIDLNSFHWEPNTTPPAEEWEALDARLAEAPATVMLWEAEPTPATRSELARRGVRVAVVPTLSNRPASGDFVSSMNAMIQTLNQITPR